ncbi:hypothetical protein A15D_00128 [Alcanivorax sp. MD8A]|uniref:hypothetical protein n=1 Tax=Alcanivorax sp. MD8A TaxID=1177157 RepID=UPI000C9CDE44|nr:hypothetical protein [Alcanivorax sp. MD8A]PNE04349.1 hypothetical protein A15D_00128 [Alcanivorax sp. MD8A]
MEKWKFDTQAGNAAFGQGHYDTAERHYLSACERANTLLQHWLDPEEIVAALVVGYQNLADLYRLQGHHHGALAALQKAHSSLTHALAQPNLSQERQQALTRGKGQTRLEIMHTLHRLGLSTRHVSQVLTNQQEHSPTLQ